MGSSNQHEVIDELFQAVADGDPQRAGDLYTDDAVVRMAGVPRHLGGVVEGRAAIVADIAQRPTSTLEVRLVFGDGERACAVVKRTGTVPSTQTFRGSDQEFTTYECVVFQLEEGRVKEQTTYANWLDAYVQTGLIDLGTLLS
jgi:ketosteroid isomerase-like protein